MQMKEIIQEILAAGKHTEQGIADYVGVSKETIRRIRTGKTKKPSQHITNGIITLYLLLKQEIK